jgi:ribosomal protein S15P/S13E
MPKKENSKKKKIEQKKVSQEEFEKKVVELGKKGITAEKIGETLRQEGIHPKDHNKKISKILKEKDLYTSPDLKNVQEKLERVKKHYEKNKQDKRALRERERIFSMAKKIRQYLKIKAD